LLFFFFQAEDGIRDSSVTGVQTCALPIYFVGDDIDVGGFHLTIEGLRGPLRTAGPCLTQARYRLTRMPISSSSLMLPLLEVPERSEERRVGKECRCREGGKHEQRREKWRV